MLPQMASEKVISLIMAGWLTIGGAKVAADDSTVAYKQQEVIETKTSQEIGNKISDKLNDYIKDDITYKKGNYNININGNNIKGKFENYAINGKIYNRDFKYKGFDKVKEITIIKKSLLYDKKFAEYRQNKWTKVPKNKDKYKKLLEINNQVSVAIEKAQKNYKTEQQRIKDLEKQVNNLLKKVNANG